MRICARTTRQAVITALAVGFWSSLVAADPIPPEVLAAELDECRLDCQESNEAGLCEVLCSCAIDRIGKKFDYAAFLEFKQQLASGNVSDANQNFSAETGLVCAAEAEQSRKK